MAIRAISGRLRVWRCTLPPFNLSLWEAVAEVTGHADPTPSAAKQFSRQLDAKLACFMRDLDANILGFAAGLTKRLQRPAAESTMEPKPAGRLDVGAHAS